MPNDKDTAKDWKKGIEKGEYGPIGEDLFAEMCMRKNESLVFDVSKDGCCEAEKSHKMNWKRNCATTNTPAIHLFKKPAEYKKCMEEAEDVCRGDNIPPPQNFLLIALVTW